MRVPDFVTYSYSDISDGGVYRYRLTRKWDSGEGVCVFLMLNPSTATNLEDDPTVRKCTNFARRWGYEALTVLNLFAYRATDPKDMRAAADPVGPLNDRNILSICKDADRVVAAWGRHGSHLNRATTVTAMLLAEGVTVHALGTTKDGHPIHPLARGKHHVPMNVEPIVYARDERQRKQTEE